VHEFGIAQEVMKIVHERAQSHGGGRVTALRLSVGEMSGVEPEALRFALEVCSRETSAEGMSVEINKTPARAQCADCRAEWHFGPDSVECPKCGGTKIAIQGGDDLRVDSFDLE
jgi:hydrogenase nickel incorporation protein HypA/HybF